MYVHRTAIVFRGTVAEGGSDHRNGSAFRFDGCSVAVIFQIGEDAIKGAVMASDAFFPFGDNIERAHRSGVSYIAQPGGSIRDDNVIDTCNKYNMTMAFTGIRLFHH